MDMSEWPRSSTYNLLCSHSDWDFEYFLHFCCAVEEGRKEKGGGKKFGEVWTSLPRLDDSIMKSLALFS